jgi:uncharacterized membrane-anchored protein
MTRPSARLWIALAVTAQLAVLASMAAEREWIFRTGQVVYLRTAPVDPRDLFRGDFVRLQYEINHVRPEGLDPLLAAARDRRRHEVMYTRLRPAGEGLYEAAGAGTARPADGPFIRGRTEDAWRLGWRGAAVGAVVKYGIEQLFVEEGAGRAIEERRGARDQLQVPMEVEVALSPGGTAVIRGYRWSRLGMKLEVVRRPEPRRPNVPQVGPLSPKLRITLANASDAPLVVVDFADRCAFHLVPVDWGPPLPPPVAAESCRTAAPTAADLITLAPGAAHSVEIDLVEPRWHVLKDGKPVEIGALQGFAQYRLEYRTPEPAAPLAQTANLWRGRMASQSFNASGVVD